MRKVEQLPKKHNKIYKGIMRTYIIPYTLSEGKLKSIYLKNDLKHLCYFVDDTKTEGDAFTFVTEELNLSKKDYKRIAYLEDFSMDSYAFEDFECLAVNVSNKKITDFTIKNDLSEVKSFDIIRTDNTILLAILMKLIFYKSLDSIEDKEKENIEI